MKFKTTFFFCLLVCTLAFGQQTISDQFDLINFDVNPAFVSTTNDSRFTAFYANGDYYFGQDHTFLLSLEHSIDISEKVKVGFAIGGAQNEYLQSGGLVFNYQRRFFKEENFTRWISFGFSVTGNQAKDYYFNRKSVFSDLGLGVNYTLESDMVERFNIGISWSKPWSYFEDSDYIRKSFKLHTEAKMKLSERVKIRPRLLFSFNDSDLVSFFGTSISYQICKECSKEIELGVIYRNSEIVTYIQPKAFIPQIAYHSKWFTLSMSFDYFDDPFEVLFSGYDSSSFQLVTQVKF